MKAGDYLIEPFLPADYEPKMWEVVGTDRGKVELARVNPTTLARTGEMKRIDLYHAKRMLKHRGADRKLVSMVRVLRQQRSAIGRYIGTLRTEVEEEPDT